MRYKNKNNIKTSLYVYVFLVLYVAFYWYEINVDALYQSTKKNSLNLKDDGYIILYNPEYITDEKLLKEDVLHCLPPDYNFIDYKYTIKNGSLTTFHRDVTSSKNIYKTKYPVYTFILYKNSGDLLSLCPGSHNSYPFVFSQINNFSGNYGTGFLFDCDLLHSGCKNKCKKREIVQYKICHKDDIEILKHLKGINVEKNDNCKITYSDYFMRKISYYFEFPINYFLYPILSKKEPTNTIIGQIQQFIPLKYYNNN
jgi:hypothetical protein